MSSSSTNGSHSSRPVAAAAAAAAASASTTTNSAISSRWSPNSKKLDIAAAANGNGKKTTSTSSSRSSKSHLLHSPSRSLSRSASASARQPTTTTNPDSNSKFEPNSNIIKPAATGVGVIRPPRRPIVEQFARTTKKEKPPPRLRLRLRQEEEENRSSDLIAELRSEVESLKAELQEAKSFNLHLQSQNADLSLRLAAAQHQLNNIITTNNNAPPPPPLYQLQRELVADHQTTKQFISRDPPALRLDQASIATTTEKEMPPSSGGPTSAPTDERCKPLPGCSSTASTPPPPPPPPLPRRPHAPAPNGKASPVVQLYQSLARKAANGYSLSNGGHSKPVVNSAHNSIVGEIQNRSAHLLAIKLDIETKADFIQHLISKVLAASYTEIEDVLNFVDWLDKELSLLADERAVLKHFNWPERKADAMREAAIEYRSLKLLKNEVSSYQDDVSTPYGVALKKMAGLLDKSERSTKRLIQLRNSAMLSYQEHQIPTSWMLDSGIVSEIKKASIMLAKAFLKRITTELRSLRSSERESIQEALLLQGVHFAYRAHQFSGGLDSETLCAFEEIRESYPGLLGSPQVFSGIQSS